MTCGGELSNEVLLMSNGKNREKRSMLVWQWKEMEEVSRRTKRDAS